MKRAWFSFQNTFVLLLFVAVLPLSARALEPVQTFTLDGQLKQTGVDQPLLDSAALLTIQILDPSKNCLLYEETHTVDTSNSEGYFNVQVGSVIGDPKRTPLDPGRTMAQIFQNTTAIAAANAPTKTCAGLSYTPSAYSARYFRLIVTPSGSGTPDTMSPDIMLDSVPSAIVAETLQGLAPSQLIQYDSSNNVGIGISAAEKLHVQGTIVSGPKSATAGDAGALLLKELTANGLDYVGFKAPDSIATSVVWTLPSVDGSAGQVLKTDGLGTLSWTTPGDFKADGSVTMTGNMRLGAYFINNDGDNNEGITIDAGGRVSIQTTSASVSDSLKLNNISSSNNSGTSIFFRSGTNITMAQVGGIVEGTTTDGRLVFNVMSGGTVTEAMRISSNLRVGVGTTSATQKFQVGDNGDGTSAMANAWNTFSDKRLKNIESKIENACEIVDHLNGYYYTWKKGKDKSRQIGVVAQEVEAVLPEIVKTDDRGIKSVDYSKLSAVLIEANKELRLQLEQSNETLQGLKDQEIKLRQESDIMKTWICSRDAHAPFCSQEGQ